MESTRTFLFSHRPWGTSPKLALTLKSLRSFTLSPIDSDPRRPYNLYCVGADAKPRSINRSTVTKLITCRCIVHSTCDRWIFKVWRWWPLVSVITWWWLMWKIDVLTPSPATAVNGFISDQCKSCDFRTVTRCSPNIHREWRNTLTTER